MYRASDLTIGDAWNIDDVFSDMNDGKGVSVILARSEKGKKLINENKKNLIIRVADVDSLLPSNSGGRKASPMNPRRVDFFEQLQSGENAFRMAQEPFLVRVKTEIKKRLRALKHGKI